MIMYDEEARRTFHDFIHQPATGRCLVFLLYLGGLCQSLAGQYEGILEELTVAIKLGVCHIQGQIEFN